MKTKSPETLRAIYNALLSALVSKMWAHAELMRERLWEHHTSRFDQDHCTKCLEYQSQFDRWQWKAFKLGQSIPKPEEQI